MTTHTTHWHGRGPDAVSVPGTVEDCGECGQAGIVCSAQYGHNPDLCYQPAGHAGSHSNRYGTTWSAS